jgi:hypothetical protein
MAHNGHQMSKSSFGRSTDYLCQIGAGNVIPSKQWYSYFLLEMMHSWTKNAFWGVNNKKWRKWCLFHFSRLITLMAYPCSHRTTNVQIKFFMFDWSIYSPFVPNTGWKRDSLQMMIFVNFGLTLSMVELKTRFETWITRNDVNGVSLFHLSYLITLMAHNGHQMSKSRILFDSSIYRLFVLNRGWKRD